MSKKNADLEFLKKLSPQREKGLRKLGTLLCKETFRQWVENGWIDLEGKSDEEAYVEVIKRMRRLTKNRPIMAVTIHHEPLLRKARIAKAEGEQELACLLYATWFEHWVNHSVHRILLRKRIDEDSINLILRDTSLRAKILALLPILGFPALKSEHCKAMLRITELRNGFVHYKYKSIDVDDFSKIAEEWETDLDRTDKATIYLQSRDTRFFLKGIKSKPRRRNTLAKRL